MTSTQLKIARRLMLKEHAQRLRKLDIDIAEAGRRERYEIPEPVRVREIITKLQINTPWASWSEIATTLNQKGFIAPHGKRWSAVSAENWFREAGK